MRKISNYMFLLGTVLAFSACESDLDGTIYNSDNAQAAVLESLTTANYVLESRNSENEAFTLRWTAPDMGYSAIVTNNIEMDQAGNNFANARTIASLSTATEQAVTVGTLNSVVLAVLNTYGIEEDYSARDYELRISTSIAQSVSPLYSNVLSLNITPYSADIQYPEIYVIGDYCGWSFDNAQSLFSFSEDEVNYEGIIDFGSSAANGFKITGAAAWDTSTGNWGTDADATAPDAEAASITLINDGSSGNISCYSKRFYRFTFSKDDLTLRNNMSFSGLYLVGSADGLTWDTSVAENILNFDSGKQRFYIDYSFVSDAEIKFLTDSNTWLGDAGDGKVGDGDNIAVTAGNYRIYVNLNNSSSQTYELNVDDYNAE